MKDISDIFEKKLNQLGIKKQVEASLVVEEVQKKLEEIFGDKANGNLRVISFNKGTLKIATRTSAWASECQGQLDKILDDEIKRVVFEVGKI